jgi:hypothetical protein
MTNPNIRIKRSAVAGKRPEISQVDMGELALNTNDGRLFTRKYNVGIGSTVTLLNVWTENIGGGAYYNEGNIGIGTDNPTSKLTIIGDEFVSGILTASEIVASTANIETLDTTTAEIDFLTNTNLNTTGIATISNLNVDDGFDVYANASVFHQNVVIQGNLTVNGTEVILNVDEKYIKDKQIVLGFSTTNNVDDTTANGGGLGIASTEGSPLVCLQCTGINTLPSTYKQLIWTKANTFGAGTTDAFLFNYAVGIGSTLVPTGTRLAVGGIHFTDNNVTASTFTGSGANLTSLNASNISSGTLNNLRLPQNISVSGIITATTFVGNLTGTALTTTNIPNLSGDISSNNTVTTLATVNSNVGTFGGTGAIPVVTVNGKGLVTGVSTVAPNNGTLSLGVSGTGLSGSSSFTANQSGASTFTVTSNATSANTNNTIVARNGSGGFVAGVVTATSFVGPLSGTATSTTNIPNLTGDVTSVNSVTSIAAGVIVDADINASAAISVSKLAASTISGITLGNNLNTLTRGTYLTGNNYNGSTATTWAVDATSANTASKVVARDGAGGFVAGVVTATSFTGSGANLTTLNASNISSGTLNNLRLPQNISVSGIITATTFSGNLQNTLTLNTSGTGLSGSTTFNNSGAATFTVTSNATSANTVSTIVARDGSGNFSAGTITANLTGTATSTTNIPNLTGAITSVNTTTSLGSFTSANLAAALTDETGSGANVFATSPTLVTPILGTPTSGTLTNCTGLPISTGVSGLAANVATFLATPSSSNLASAVTDETGTGVLVFATSPTLVTPVLGSASATSINVSGIVTATTFVGNITGNLNSSGVNTAATLSGTSLTYTTGSITNISGTNINYSGISTFLGNVNIGGTVSIGTAIDIVPYDTLNNGTLSFEGSAGQLFSITNNLTSGSIFSVNDVSGIPSIDVDADGTIQIGPYGGNLGVGTTNPTSKLTVIGDVLVSGIVTATTFVGPLSGTATSTTNIPNLTGDISSVNTTTTLATVNSNVGTFGGTGAIPVVTVNGKGLVTGISTVAPNNGTLTLAVSGTGLSGSASFTANQSGASTFTVTSNATSANSNNTIVARDGSGNFSAGTITANLTGTASNVTTNANLTGDVTSIGNATAIATGVIVNADINASAAIAVSKLAASTISGITLGNNLNTLTIGTGLSGSSYNGSSAVTIAIDSTVATLTGTQTLTNKTLTSPTLTTPVLGAATATSINASGAITANSYNVGTDVGISTTRTTVATTAATTIDSFAIATFRSARVQVQITQGTNYQTSDVLIIHNGTTANIVEYGSIATNDYLGTFSSTVSGGNCLLQINMSSATSSTVKVLSQRITI